MASQLVNTIKGKPHIWSHKEGRHLPCKDSTAELVVDVPKKVMQWASKNGVPEDHWACHYAIVWPRIPGVEVLEAAVRVNHTYLRFASDPEVWVKYSNPYETRRFIREFDQRGAAVVFGKMFEIRLKPVEPSMRQGYRRGKKGGASRKVKNRNAARSNR